MALDGDTGLVDWSFAPPEGGELNPHLWIGPRRVALQVRKPNAILVLETASGRRLAEFPQTDQDGAWMRDPLPIDDDRVALVTDRRTVALFDLGRGAYAWIFRESPTLPTYGPPRLLGDAERLLVIHDGNELIRLDPATGAKRWSRPLGVEDLSERPEAMALDADRFYWASGRTLNAAALGDGELAWRRHLTGPEAGWSLALTERCVAAFPGPSGSSPEGAIGLPPGLPPPRHGGPRPAPARPVERLRGRGPDRAPERPGRHPGRPLGAAATGGRWTEPAPSR